MSTNEVYPVYASISQRAASTYCRMLAQFQLVLPEGLDAGRKAAIEAEQSDLHAFFQALYQALYDAPGNFGLPLSPDQYLVTGMSKGGQDKAAINRVLGKPRKLFDAGLGFLWDAALQGQMEGESLVIPQGSSALDFLKKKPGRAWVKGMEKAGLFLSETNTGGVMISPCYPGMLPALQDLARACAACKDPSRGRIFFARCDFRALRGDFKVEALDLFHVFRPQDFARATELHAFFNGRSYKTIVGIGNMFSFLVQYQGKKSVKSTPLFQIDFDERQLRQFCPGIKCASAYRIAPLVQSASQALQDDFARRANTCANCHWCDSQKTLHPVEYEYRGEKRKICWYIGYDVTDLSDEAVDLVKEYTLLHESLG